MFEKRTASTNDVAVRACSQCDTVSLNHFAGATSVKYGVSKNFVVSEQHAPAHGVCELVAVLRVATARYNHNQHDHTRKQQQSLDPTPQERPAQPAPLKTTNIHQLQSLDNSLLCVGAVGARRSESCNSSVGSPLTSAGVQSAAAPPIRSTGATNSSKKKRQIFQIPTFTSFVTSAIHNSPI